MKPVTLLLAVFLPISPLLAQTGLQPQLPTPGVNFGNMLEAPKEGAWGVTLKESYFATVAQAGFKTVRIPIRWSARAALEAPYTIDPVFFARVDRAVEAGKKKNLTLILDLHNYDALYLDPDSNSARFVALWKQIAEHYQGQPPSVVFELCNEPCKKLDAARWNALLAETLAVVRPTNPDRTVIVGPVQWNSIGKLPELVLPEGDPHLLVTVHYYDPMHFTHQGASWIEGADAWMGTRWNGTEAEKAAIDGALDKVVAWGQAHHRPMFVGEFGAYEKGPLEDRVRWTSYVARALGARGLSSAYWEFASGFGIYDPKADQWREPLLRALVPGA